MLPAAVGHVAGAHQAGPHAAAHALLHGHLAGHAELLSHLGHIAQHGFGAAGQDGVVVLVLRELLADQGVHKAVVAQRAVISGHHHLGALLLQMVQQNSLLLGAEAHNGGGFFGGILGTAPDGGHADAAAHQQIAALGLHSKAVAQQAHYVHTVAHGAVGQPLGALAPDLEDDGQGVLRLLLHAGAHGDGPAQEQGIPALDVDELARPLPGGADHVPHLQHHVDGVAVEPVLGYDLALAFYFHTWHHPFGKF